MTKEQLIKEFRGEVLKMKNAGKMPDWEYMENKILSAFDAGRASWIEEERSAWIRDERCVNCGAKKENDLATMCDDCYENE